MVSCRTANICLIFTTIFFILSIQNGPINGLSSKELCLNKICSGCIAGSLSCQEGGLTKLPDSLTADIKSMILMGHRFDQPILMSENFTVYTQQNVKLQRLTLRNCAVQTIYSGTFKSIPSLQQLDLSKNQIQLIKRNTFEGLNLDFLRLDENPGLKFEFDAFKDAKILSLSINQCGLTSLTFDIMEPLMLSKQLTNLHLSGNQLITLESRFEPLFLQLQSLSLEQNPFNCDCKLNWLSGVLHRRQIKQHTPGLIMYNDAEIGDTTSHNNNFNNLYANRDASSVEIQQSVPLDGDLLKPVCRTPRRLSGRTIESLKSSDFYCGTPKLQIFEIDLGQLGNVNSENGESLLVTLRCYVKGSPELKVEWYRQESDDSMIQTSDTFNRSFTLKRLPNTKLLGSGGIELKLTRNIIGEDNRDQTKWSSNLEKLLCFASDSNGNTSAEVIFRWPMPTERAQTPPLHYKNQINKHATGVQLKPAYEMGNTNWYTIIQDERDNLLFQKQFSILEMIGAVVGTFTATLTLFVCGCCLLRFVHFHRDKVRSKILLHHANSPNSYQNNVLTVNENSKPPSYSNTTTSILNNHNTNNPGVNNLATSYMTTNYPIGNGHILSGRGELTHLPYTSYEPISIEDAHTTNSYSDSQTYDLPRIASPTNIGLNAPLPPLPSNTFMTNSPVQMSFKGPLVLENDETNLPFLVSPLACASVGETVGPAINDPALTPVLINNSRNFSAVISAAATLNRLHHQHQHHHHQQQQLQQQNFSNQINMNNVVDQQSRLLDFINQQHLLHHQDNREP